LLIELFDRAKTALRSSSRRSAAATGMVRLREFCLVILLVSVGRTVSKVKRWDVVKTSEGEPEKVSLLTENVGRACFGDGPDFEDDRVGEPDVYFQGERANPERHRDAQQSRLEN
jgi:hypothetical protein